MKKEVQIKYIVIVRLVILIDKIVVSSVRKFDRVPSNAGHPLDPPLRIKAFSELLVRKTVFYRCNVLSKSEIGAKFLLKFIVNANCPLQIGL